MMTRLLDTLICLSLFFMLWSAVLALLILTVCFVEWSADFAVLASADGVRQMLARALIVLSILSCILLKLSGGLDR
jgi:hypothetical protein